MGRWNSPMYDLNRSKYSQAPTWDQIQEFISETKMDVNHFEKFYGIPFNTLHQVKAGTRKLPVALWDIIYEKIIPTYGIGFLHEIVRDKKIAEIKKDKVVKSVTHTPINHPRLSNLG